MLEFRPKIQIFFGIQKLEFLDKNGLLKNCAIPDEGGRFFALLLFPFPAAKLQNKCQKSQNVSNDQ